VVQENRSGAEKDGWPLCLPLWCVPNFLVHTWGFLAIVFRHSSNGENFAAIRMGQQALQGSHLAPSVFLRRTEIPDFLPPVTSFRLGAHSFACEEVLAERVAFEPSSEVFLQRDTDHRTVNRGPR
jgi:hypothetical protein